MDYHVVSLERRPELLTPLRELLAVGWPEFMRHDPTAERFETRLAGELGAFQLLLVDEKDDLAAVAASIPFVWDGTEQGLPAGWDAVVEQGVRDHDRGLAPTALSALSITVARDRLGQGVSRLALQALRRKAARANLTLLAPVRPTLKARYPLAPMERYVRWTRPDGTPFEADVATWEGWTDMAFPETGHYVVPGALVPVEIDREREIGRYLEPNVWVQHATGTV